MLIIFLKSKNMRKKFLVNGKTQNFPTFRRRRKLILFPLMFAFIAHTLYGQVVINEIMANNKTIIKSNTGKYSDWIELYNAGTQPFNLAGFMISDNPENPSRYIIPSGKADSTTIAPNSFMVFWADGNPLAGIRHLPFKLNKKGEFLAIYSFQQGKIVCIDSVRYKAMKPDVSFGRKPDGGRNWVDFKKPTPGTKN